MAVYVDPLLPCVPKPNWQWDHSSHLWTDSADIEELHAFARKLGLRRAWFQNKEKLPHYDLTPAKRKHAVQLGALELTRADAVAMWRRLRSGEVVALPEANRPSPETLDFLSALFGGVSRK